MLDSYILLQIRNLTNLIDYLRDIHFCDCHNMTEDDLVNLQNYLYMLENRLT